MHGKKVGIGQLEVVDITLFDDIKDILDANLIPILVITPDTVKHAMTILGEGYISFYIDSDDEILDKRINFRDNGIDLKREKKTRANDRKYKLDSTYRINNDNELENALAVINEVWRLRKRNGVLTQNIIKTFIRCNILLENATVDNVKSASYDLRLGSQYYHGGEIKELSESKPFLQIEPYDYAIVSCKEISSLPNDIVARFDLSVNLFRQGIILSNGPQMDPGFRGTLFCLLFNTSDRSVYLKRDEHYATIEFTKLIETTVPYRGKYQDEEKIEKYISSDVLRGGIHELKKEISELKKDNKAAQNMLIGIITLMMAIISIILIVK